MSSAPRANDLAAKYGHATKEEKVKNSPVTIIFIRIRFVSYWLLTIQSVAFPNEILHVPDPVMSLLVPHHLLKQIADLVLVDTIFCVQEFLTCVILVGDFFQLRVNAVVIPPSKNHHF